MGDAFIHLIPEAIGEEGVSIQTSMLITTGILIFFVLEKIIHWRHCHNTGNGKHIHPFAIVNLYGDSDEGYKIIGVKFSSNLDWKDKQKLDEFIQSVMRLQNTEYLA